MPAPIILFQAHDATNGYELWISDGTAAGTSMLKDINPTASSNPTGITAIANGKALFAADDGVHGMELWITDGTAGGTSMVKDVYSGTGASYPIDITPLSNGKTLFSAYDAVHGRELWITDGTSAGTSMVVNMGTDPTGGYPTVITALGNGKALFRGSDGVHDSELWITDGTAAGTSLLVDLYPGPHVFSPDSIISLGNGSALFAADDGVHGNELWKTDGTAAGTSMVIDLLSDPTGAMPQNFASLGNGHVLFQAADAAGGFELFVSDGTAAGTSLLKDIDPGRDSSNPNQMVSLGNGHVLFQADDGVHGRELWISDGTSAGTSLLKDIEAGTGDSYPEYFTSLGNGTAVFRAYDSAHHTQLWITDGTAAGTSLFVDPTLGSGVAYPSDIALLTAPCFTTGTLIATPDGQRAVEHLRKGDLVLTHAGAVRPVNWVGHRDLNLRAHPDPIVATPIVIRAGALADGVPARDLRVSPEHAMYLRGALVPARFLVNGATILRDDHCDAVTYFHIELETHDILIAEGAPSESFLDTGNRGLFQNADAPLILHPRFEDGQDGRRGRSCARFIDDAAELEPIWREFADRALLLGHTAALHALTQDAEPRLMVGDRVIAPIAIAGDCHTFVVPAVDGAIRLVSRASRPSGMMPWYGDDRMLGLSVRRIRLRDQDGIRDIALDGPAMADGWWAIEADTATTWRWTDGNAALPIATGSACVVEITAGRMAHYKEADTAPSVARAA